MKYKIVSLWSKIAKTKYGDKEHLTVKFNDKNLPAEFFGVFANARTKDWKVGDEVELEKEWLVSREWEGKTRWDIKFPKGSFTNFNEQFSLLADRVAELERRITKFEADELRNNETPAESVNVKDIPF